MTDVHTPLPAAPVQLTGFVGREQELATIGRLLSSSRLLTLTGAGGSGKTRLALAAVARAHNADGVEVAWVELASLADPSALTTHLALAFGARTDGGVSAERAIVAMLRERRLLLVLDNCEHLVDECARLVQLLLQACPLLRVLATSREALGIGGERSWLVPALSLPTEAAAYEPSVALRAEAVRLFVDRAQDVQSEFALTQTNVNDVVQICRRVDGLPLAIELAAARVNVLSPQEIAARLDNRFALLATSARAAQPRHRTLRAAVDWSYELLSAREKLLLERLSIFSGGFTLDAAESVCIGGEIDRSNVLELVAMLATRSLVTMQEDDGRARYRLLETIREYAIERRATRAAEEQHGDSSLHERHARFYLALARDAEPELLLGRAPRMRQMDVEHDNVRAALAWSATAREGSRVGLPLAWAMMWYWFHRQHWREGFRQFQGALASADNPSTELRAAALHATGLFGLYAADPKSGERLREADALWRTVGNATWLGFTLLVRTVEASLRNAPVDARRFADEAVAVARTVADPWHEALAVAHALVPVLLWEEAWEEAEAALRHAERIYRERAYEIGVAYVLDARAFTSLQLGDRERAARLAHASLGQSLVTENRWLAGRSLRVLGKLAIEEEKFDRAAALYGAADAMYEAIGALSLTGERRAVNDGPALLRELMDPTVFDAQWQAGRALSLREAAALALADPIAARSTESVASDGDAVPTETNDTSADARASDAPTLSVRALGALEIRQHGLPLPDDAWPYAKPRELLLYLLAHPEGRTREQIGLDFWPEISAAQVKNNFHVTLHHLRKALGDAELVRYERGKYRVATERGVEFDALAFEGEAMSALRQLRTTRSSDAAARALDAATTRYRGAFLDGLAAGDWHLELRDRLARLYEESLETLGAFHDAHGNAAEAAESYRRLVDADALHESAVRQLMLALARDGRRSDALKRFERFRQTLASELAATPSHETTLIAENIRKENSK